MANTKDLAKLLDKGNIQAAFQEALKETADSMVDEITEQAVAMIRDEAVVFLEARKEELIKQLKAIMLRSETVFTSSCWWHPLDS